MNTKIITAALAFFTTFGFSSLMMQFALNKSEPQPNTTYSRLFGKPTNRQVLRFLQQDIRNGQQRTGRLSQYEWQYQPPFGRSALAEYAEAVAIYVNKSGNMDDSELPQDLQIAWREHIEAWRDYSAFLTSLENLSPDEMRKLNVRIQYEVKDARISSTWFKVLEIAGENYGAYPAGAY
jgi:hypothetical protein